MTHGYVSDVDGDDTVMDSPQVTVSIDLTELPPGQALAIAQEAGLDQQEKWVVGQLVQGEQPHEDDIEDAEFHLPLGVGLTVLSQAGVIDLPEDPQAVVEGNQQG